MVRVPGSVSVAGQPYEASQPGPNTHGPAVAPGPTAYAAPVAVPDPWMKSFAVLPSSSSLSAAVPVADRNADEFSPSSRSAFRFRTFDVELTWNGACPDGTWNAAAGP